MITGNGKITWKVSWTFSITSDIAAGLNQLTIIFLSAFNRIYNPFGMEGFYHLNEKKKLYARWCYVLFELL